MNALPAPEEIWQEMSARLTEAVTDRSHPLRLLTVATVDDAGLPQARTVVLRHFGQRERQVIFHLDRRSPKFAQMQARPQACLLWYDEATRTQVRLPATVTLHTADAVSHARWQNCQPMAKACYASTHGPSEMVDDSFTLSDAETARHWDVEQEAAAEANFAVAICTFGEVDLYRLAARSSTRHRLQWQASANGEGHWQIQKLAP